MTGERLDLIEARIELREDAVVRAQLQELVDEVRASWGREGPSPAWLEGRRQLVEDVAKMGKHVVEARKLLAEESRLRGEG